MNLFEKYEAGLPYEEFLNRHGTDAHRARWKSVYDQIVLTEPQRELLAGFRREIKIIVLAGAWCGDCVGQCPIFQHFAEVSPTLKIHYLDRDEHADVQAMLQINGGNRVPVVVFFSEDGHEVARYGERTLSKYRRMATDQLGATCPTGVVVSGDPLLAEVTQEWLNEYERVQWILRLSPRLRQKHGD